MFSCICHDSRIAPPMFHTEACTNVAGGECVCVCGGGGGGTCTSPFFHGRFVERW